MNIKKLILVSLAGFIFVFVFEMLWHGFLMKGMYDATASVWRPEEEHNFPIMMISQFLFAFGFAFFHQILFKKHIPCKTGLGVGMAVGFILAAPQLATHSYLPIPLSISLLWMLAAFLKSVGTSAVVAAIHK